VKRAAGLTAVSTRTYQEVLARVHASPVCATLPLGWEARDVEALNGRDNGFFDAHDGCLHWSYVGTILPNGFGTLRALLEAARRVRDQDSALYSRMRLHFFGTSNQSSGALQPRVLPLAREVGVDDIVSEHPARIPYLDALRVLRQSSAILLLGSSEKHYTASKLYPALLAGRPMLALFHEASSVSSILRRIGRAPFVQLVTHSGDERGTAPDVERVSAALLDLARIPAGAPARAIDWSGAEDVSASNLAATLARLLDRIAGARAHGTARSAEPQLSGRFTSLP
jgi:hypothetical protein